MNNIPQTTNNSMIRAWAVCMVAALFFFYIFVQLNMFNAVAHGVMREFSLDATQLGKLSSLFFYANLIFLLPAGILLDRYSPRLWILILMAVCVLGTLIFAYTNTYWVAALARFLTGIGSAFGFLGAIRLATRWIPTHHLALASGLIVTIGMAGGMAAQTPLTLLVGHFGWRNAIYIDGLVGIAFFILMLVVVQDSPKNASAQLDQEVKIGFLAGIQQAYLNRQNWLCGIYTSLMNLPIFILGAIWGLPYLMQAHNLTAVQASYATSMIFAGTVIGSPVMGWISDRLGQRRLPMLLGALSSLIVMLFIIFSPTLNTLSLALLFLLLGFITSTQVLTYPTVAAANPPALSATAISVISFCAVGGGALLQPLFGKILDWRGVLAIQHGIHIYSYSAYLYAMMILPVAFIISLVAARSIREVFGKN